MSVFGLCETHCQQVPEFSCALVFPALSLVELGIFIHTNPFSFYLYGCKMGCLHLANCFPGSCLQLMFPLQDSKFPLQDNTLVGRIQGVLSCNKSLQTRPNPS